MKIKVLAKTKNKLQIEIEGEGHTFCNLLQHVLLEDKTVEIAGYDIPHPLVGKPIMHIRTREGRSPEKVLLKALERIGELSSEFLKEFEKATQA